MKCNRCGKENPAGIHTCTPRAIALAEEMELCWADAGLQLQSAAELRRLHAENEALREALRIARDHIEMDALEISHCKDAAMIRAALTLAGELK